MYTVQYLICSVNHGSCRSTVNSMLIIYNGYTGGFSSERVKQFNIVGSALMKYMDGTFTSSVGSVKHDWCSGGSVLNV